MADQAPGWHADPAGRHQYRFWDGTRWTEQVADSGVTSTDPVSGSPAGGPAQPGGADAVPPSGPGGAPLGASDPPPSGGSNGVKIIAVAVIALVVAGVVFALVRSDDDDKAAGPTNSNATSTNGTDEGQGSPDGTGRFTLTVTRGEVTTHDFEVKAGDALCAALGGPGADDVAGVLGVDEDGAGRLLDGGYYSDGEGGDYSAAARVYSDIVSDFTDAYDTDALVNEFPGFTGLVVGEIDNSSSSNRCFAWPVDAKVTVVLSTTKPSVEVDLVIGTKANPDASGDYDSDGYERLYSDVFYSDYADAFSDDHPDLYSDDNSSSDSGYSDSGYSDTDSGYSDPYSDEYSS